jgi:hypothetical protein
MQRTYSNPDPHGALNYSLTAGILSAELQPNCGTSSTIGIIGKKISMDVKQANKILKTGATLQGGI